MKLFIPVSAEQITLKRFVDYHTANDNVERVMIAVNKSREYCEGLKVETVQTVIDLFEAACLTGKETHTPTVTIEGVKLGFIPDLNSMTFREHVDLDQLSKSIWLENGTVDYKNLPQLMAILYRPVTEQVGEYYNISKYDSDNVKKYMKAVNGLTMDRVQGGLLFFSTIAAELVNNSLESLDRMLKTEIREITHPQG
jgi:hypothetical protein